MEDAASWKIKEQGGVYSVFWYSRDFKTAGVYSRGNIHDFSRKSRSRMCQYLSSCEAVYTHMVTLTYAPDGDVRACKHHLRAFIERLRRYHGQLGRGRPEFSVFWFVEFQGNGRPHFHLFTTFAVERYWLSRSWYEIAGQGNVKHFLAGTNVEKLRSGRNGSCAYASKYASKNEQKILPDLFKDSGVGRWWGVVGHRKVVSADTRLWANVGEVSGIFDLLKNVETALEFAETKGLAKKLTENGAFVQWKVFDEDLRWEIHRLIKDLRRRKQWSRSAITSPLERKFGHLRRRIAAESYARQSQTAYYQTT